ncbi:hypothetical protein F8M41_001478 [Gigaspora margarita]|uniref:Uncharacterized protein n=1 Tax=Gigaspora margarita TaxID=4874 RepID=A0A8H4AA08_GIGMA|nr:hypothetical protein F8M41_001478 [Gigaspora margarita]
MEEDLYSRGKEKKIKIKKMSFLNLYRKTKWEEHKVFRHLKKSEETEDKVNVLEVYQKKQVKPKRSPCKNSDRKVLVIGARSLGNNSSIKKELGKSRRKVEEKAKGDLKAQIRLVTCYQERSETKKKDLNGITEFERIKKDKRKTCFNSSENYMFDDGKTQQNKIRRSQSKEERKVETVPIGHEKIVDSKNWDERNNKLLTGDRKRSIEEQHNDRDRRPLNGDTLEQTCG